MLQGKAPPNDQLGVVTSTTRLIWCLFVSLSSETHGIIDRMDDSETYMNVQIVKSDSTSPSRVPVPYPTLQEQQLDARGADVAVQESGNLPKDEHPIASGAAEMSVTAQAGLHKQKPNENIGNRPDRKICLLCLITFFLIATVVGLSIHVSLIRPSEETCHRNYQAELRHQFTEMEAKYRSVNETKAQICEFLTSRREQTCSENWVTNKDRCYYVSKSVTSFYKANQECSNGDSRLLEINSRDEATFVSDKLVNRSRAYWIGQCEDRNVGWSLLYKPSSGTPVCSQCVRSNPCDGDRHFICEKSAPLFPDIPETIQGLCQQAVQET
ncbi:C-type lectin domain family 12 member A-like [Hemitrygon akajei]|uniref:C-type lectin domain family 12 member A-like n=1 Tax=Hemitrygon akajei TaxID=2704970 RepID=UPI003BF98C91